jgi:diaminohydroxyphosphoribosylaminopyrimidine deaminase/5-amino-6-(5-phosphoribosylamino)uracil reductase
MVGSPADLHMMQRALLHAARGQGRTTPNPMVGAIVVSAGGVVVGHGWHERAGEAHAEVHALEAAGPYARGGVLYVTLEPCCHTGRTGPCTDRVIEAGIARVVAAMRDPDERVSGAGFARLRERGIVVDEGVCEDEAQRLNQPFSTVKTRRRPLVMLKAATSIDACVAEAPGHRTQLTSKEANRKTHVLRAAVDAIAVGSETMIVDDPLLTARECPRVRPLVRVVFDRRLRMPGTARVLTTLEAGPVIIFTTELAHDQSPDRVSRLETAGARVVPVSDLTTAVQCLLEWDVSTLLVEGGPTLQRAFWEADLVDRFHLVITPRVLGASGVKLFDGSPSAQSDLVPVAMEPRGADMWIESDVHRHR